MWCSLFSHLLVMQMTEFYILCARRPVARSTNRLKSIAKCPLTEKPSAKRFFGLKHMTEFHQVSYCSLTHRCTLPVHIIVILHLGYSQCFCVQFLSPLLLSFSVLIHIQFNGDFSMILFYCQVIMSLLPMSTVIIGGRDSHNYDSHTVVQSRSSICYQSTCSFVVIGAQVSGWWHHRAGLC